MGRKSSSSQKAIGFQFRSQQQFQQFLSRVTLMFNMIGMKSLMKRSVFKEAP